MKHFEVSYVISNELASWPGDLPFESESQYLNISTNKIFSSYVKSSLHFGTHVDSPKHFDINKASIDELALTYFIGKCQVIEIDPGISLITVKDIKEEIKAKRVFFKTSSFNAREGFNKSFTSFDSSTIEYLSMKGVITIGIDTPSIDRWDSEHYSCHNISSSLDIVIYENLNLESVSKGIYKLVSIPLRLKGLEASPIRAILEEI